MSETINDRIEMLVNKHYNGNKAAFARAIGLNPTALSSYIGTQRRSKPNVDMVVKIMNVTGVDPRWLLTGEESCHINISNSGNMMGENSGTVNQMVETDAAAQEKIKLLEALLEEKERLIQVLMTK